ncbi:MAG: hypothetical protein Q7L55_08995 [Actinomycetota bacterium]|nr:hypothetical protein [Actinomycetota bacterium]
MTQASAFELLASGDTVAPDHDVAMDMCHREWGLPEQKESWIVSCPPLGAKWTYARVNLSRQEAPTFLNILGVPFHAPARNERPSGYAFLPEIAAAQGIRPARNHATVVASRNIDGLAQRLQEAGVKFRYDPPDDNLAIARIWVGFTEGMEDSYEPAADAGLRLEVIPYEAVRPPSTAIQPDEAGSVTGAGIRIAARTLLMRNLDLRISTLESIFEWRPQSDHISKDGTRRVRFAFANPKSAVIELVHPARESIEGGFLEEWGEGPFSLRLEVPDVASVQDRLQSCDAPWMWMPPAGPNESSRLLRHPQWQLGTGFEFVPSESQFAR